MAQHSHVFYPSLGKIYPSVERENGVRIRDADGKEYIDCAAGVAVSAIGYGVKEVIDAICRQLNRANYVYGTTFTSPAREELASQIIARAPAGMKRVFFCSGGSEAVETMLKIAYQYHVEKGNPLKRKIISRWQSYHGNTVTAMAVGGRASWRNLLDPILPHTPHISQCNCYRCPFGLEYPSCKLACANELERVIKYEGAHSVAAFLLEPVSGTTAAAVVPPVEYFHRVREICDKYDVLLCADEVLTGVGRTGKNFAVDHFGITPDLMSVAKGLGGGYVPIGGVIVHERVSGAFERGSGATTNTYTFGGAPVACASASAVLHYIDKHNLVARSAAMGGVFQKKLKCAVGSHPMVGEIRGLGLLLGIELVRDKNTKEPFACGCGAATRVAEYCFAHGVILLAGVSGTADGVDGDALQLSPPLIIDEADMDAVCAVLAAGLDAVYRELCG